MVQYSQSQFDASKNRSEVERKSEGELVYTETWSKLKIVTPFKGSADARAN